MSKIGLHFQLGLPHWAADFYARSGALWGKLMDPGDAIPLPELPNLRWIIRFMEDEGTAKAEVMAGVAGAWQRYKRLEPELARRPWLSDNRFYLESMNEPSNAHILFSKEGRLALNEHEAALARILWEERGIRSVGYNLGVGHPEPEHVGQLFSKGLPSLKKYNGMWSMHEYGWPYMTSGNGWYTLRYRRIIAELDRLGIEYPRLAITECGIDKLIIGEVGGWKVVDNNYRWFVDTQLAWYDRNLMEDACVEVATPFTSTPAPEWLTYEVDEPTAMYLADYIVRTPTIGPANCGDHGFSIIDTVDELPKHKTKVYNTRSHNSIKRTVIHHSAVKPKRTDEAYIRRYITATANYHIRHNDWPGIGYHYMIDPDGRIFKVNKETTISNHVGGYNSSSIGICLIGLFTGDNRPTDRQLAAARWLVNRIGLHAVPHKDLNQTSCPGNWNSWGSEII